MIKDFDRITFEAGVMVVAPTFAACACTVGLIVSRIAEGASAQDLLHDYPDLEAEDIRQSLAYAAWLAQEQVITA